MIEIQVNQKGKKTEDWLRKIARGDISAELSRFGQMGVDALSIATPMDSGITATSWGYNVVYKGRRPIRIEWYNTNVQDGIPVAILIQYGHATRAGTYIQGRDFINPAMRPVFDKITREIWKKVRNG